MKVLHTSDWHLGRILHEHSLLEDQRFILKKILATLQNCHYDLMIISGDIYDRSLPPADAVELFSWFLTELRKSTSVEVCIIPGNHDSSLRLSYCSELMKISGIYFKTDPFTSDIPISIRGESFSADIFCIPYLYPNTFNVHSDSDVKERMTHDMALNEVAERIKKNINRDVINIAVAHLFTSGGEVSDSERRFVGASEEVSPAFFKNFDYTALGHLHRPQRVDDNIYYSGSIMKYSFSEVNDLKGINSVDVEKGRCKVERVELQPLREMRRLKGIFSDFIENKDFEKYCEDYIEIEITDDNLIVNPHSALKERFPYLLSVRQRTLPSKNTDSFIEISREDRSIVEDFSAFHDFLYEEKPSAEMIDLFNDVYQKGRTE